MMRFLITLIAFFLAVMLPAQAGQKFAVVGFHDVVDFRGDLDDDAVTVDRLIGFFEWLRAHRWTAISLDDVEAARLGRKPLPERAILITFDDGYRSVYTRVFPLVLAYRMPIVIAVVGQWVDAPMEGTVRYGDREVPRSKFLSWEELREMSRSGLVEIGSHSYGLHQGVLGNPQGNELPAAANRRYVPGQGYESGEAFRQRIREDLRKSRDLLKDKLGQAPRAMVWPFGRYHGDAVAAAREVGFRFALTLDPEPADVSRPMAIGRFLPTNDPELAVMVSNIQFEDPLPSARRLVAYHPEDYWQGGAPGADDRLGAMIERQRTLGATGVVLDAVELNAEGQITAAWFPNSHLPVRADVLSRLAWQLQSRGGLAAFVRLPTSAALEKLHDPGKVLSLFGELGTFVPMSGLFIDDAPGLLHAGKDRRTEVTPWEVRGTRTAVKTSALPADQALALRAFRAVEYSRPGMQLVLVTDKDAPLFPSPIADLTLRRIEPNPRQVRQMTERLRAAGWLVPVVARRSGLWFVGDRPPGARDLTSSARIFLSQGGAAFGWATDDAPRDLPPAVKVAPIVSGAHYPVKF